VPGNRTSADPAGAAQSRICPIQPVEDDYRYLKKSDSFANPVASIMVPTDSRADFEEFKNE